MKNRDEMVLTLLIENCDEIIDALKRFNITTYTEFNNDKVIKRAQIRLCQLRNGLEHSEQRHSRIRQTFPSSSLTNKIAISSGTQQLYPRESPMNLQQQTVYSLLFFYLPLPSQ